MFLGPSPPAKFSEYLGLPCGAEATEAVVPPPACVGITCTGGFWLFAPVAAVPPRASGEAAPTEAFIAAAIRP